MYYEIAYKISLSLRLPLQGVTNAPVLGLPADVPPRVLLCPACQEHKKPERSSNLRLGSGRRSAVAQRAHVVTSGGKRNDRRTRGAPGAWLSGGAAEVQRGVAAGRGEEQEKAERFGRCWEVS